MLNFQISPIIINPLNDCANIVNEKKKLQKNLCLKCVSGPIKPKKYIHQKQFFFPPLGVGLRIFSMFRKKKIPKNFMFKMCFRPHRTQKIYSLKTKFFFLNNEKIGGWT